MFHTLDRLWSSEEVFFFGGERFFIFYLDCVTNEQTLSV